MAMPVARYIEPPATTTRRIEGRNRTTTLGERARRAPLVTPGRHRVTGTHGARRGSARPSPAAARRLPPRGSGRGNRPTQSPPRGRPPFERRIQASATECFQPTSDPCPPLGELADQPPCQQARRDQAVRFQPTGTGHERDAHFPGRPVSETLRDRMLPAKLPCRHSPGWSTCHAGTTGRSRFDLGCRRLGTRATPRGNVQERQGRKDQEDANTEGGLAS